MKQLPLMLLEAAAAAILTKLNLKMSLLPCTLIPLSMSDMDVCDQ
jgi:hypothetical protein